MKARVPRSTRKDTLPKRSRILGVRLTEGQYAAVERAAAKLGLDPSSFGRMQVLKGTDYSPDEEK